MNHAKFNSRSNGRALPTDIEPGEAELIEALDRLIHATHPNPRRIGCPGKLALAELVVTDSRFDDDYTLKHIGECAACLDDLTELHFELKRMNERSQ
jgi:hypothetical protein